MSPSYESLRNGETADERSIKHEDGLESEDLPQQEARHESVGRGKHDSRAYYEPLIKEAGEVLAWQEQQCLADNSGVQQEIMDSYQQVVDLELTGDHMKDAQSFLSVTGREPHLEPNGLDLNAYHMRKRIVDVRSTLVDLYFDREGESFLSSLVPEWPSFAEINDDHAKSRFFRWQVVPAAQLQFLDRLLDKWQPIEGRGRIEETLDAVREAARTGKLDAMQYATRITHIEQAVLGSGKVEQNNDAGLWSAKVVDQCGWIKHSCDALAQSFDSLLGIVEHWQGLLDASLLSEETLEGISLDVEDELDRVEDGKRRLATQLEDAERALGTFVATSS